MRICIRMVKRLIIEKRGAELFMSSKIINYVFGETKALVKQ